MPGGHNISKPPRVFADTNILISAFISSGPPASFLSGCKEGEYVLIFCSYLLDELNRVLKDKFLIPSKWRQYYIDALLQMAEFVIPGPIKRVVIPDPDDDLILACAKGGRADFIITGDKHLLSLGKYEGLRILKVAEFLKQHREKTT